MELNNSPRKIVLISSGQPSLNPRLVKEADALSNAGYSVTVLYAYWNSWGTAIDKTLLPSKKWQAIRIGGDPEQKPVIYFLSRLIHKLSLTITRATKFKYLADFAIARSSFFLIREARKHTADLYIGHNLGALPATVKAAKFHQKPCGFDAEDFHRNEVSDDAANVDVQLRKVIEDNYIDQLNYLSSSSSAISDAYYKLYKGKTPVTILNVFSIDRKVPVPSSVTGAILKLFWFSQTVGPGRGIEDCIEALQVLKDPDIELHLLGFATDEGRQQLIEMAGGNVSLYIHQPVSPDDIAFLASGFDIGLALEGKVPLNRDICLTNKIFTYMQAGLAILASDTTAQKGLLSKYAGIGKVYESGNIESLAAAIQYFRDNRDRLYRAKKASWEIAGEEFNWEKESKKFLEVIAATI